MDKMTVQELGSEIKVCLDKMHGLEHELEKAYAEENDILVKKYTEELDGLNERYFELRKTRTDKV